MFSTLRRLRWGAGLLIAVAGLLAAPPAYGQGAWPTFRQNPQRTGATGLQGPVTPEVRWRYDLGGYAYSSPSVGPNGVVYVGSADSIYAVNPDGTRRWAQAVPVQDYAISSPAVASDGTVFVGSRDENLYVIWEDGGQPQVQIFPVGDEVWSSPLLPTGGSAQAIFGADDGYVYRLDNARSGGTLTPFYPTATAGSAEPAEIVASPALGRDGTVYVGSVDRQLYAIRPNGQNKWAPFQTGGEVVATPVVAGTAQDQAIIVASRDSSVYAVDPGTGAELWSADIGRDLIASPAVRGTAVYVATYEEGEGADGQLLALDVRTGQEQWTQPLNGPVVSSPAVDGAGRIYVGTLNNTLYAFEADGTSAWPPMTLDSPVWSSPSIGADEILYVATAGTENRNGTLYAIESALFIVQTDPEEGEAGNAVDITAEPTGTPTAATLFARPGGARDFVAIGMNPTGVGTRVAGSIPETLVTQRGVEYYIRLEFSERVETFPSVNPETNPATLRVRVPGADPAGAFLPRRYRMVSVPLDLEDAALETVFADYGPYQQDQWRLLRWTGNAYAELPDLTVRATPGTAFFLITQWGTSFRTGEGVSVNTNGPYVLSLRPGWNQISNPFAFPVAWRSVQRDPQAVQVGDIAVFRDGIVQIPTMVDTLRLMPWDGYFVYNRSATSTSLIIPADEAPNASEQAPAAQSLEVPVMLALRAVLPEAGVQDVHNWVGWAGADQVDRYTMIEAPPLDASLRLSVWEGGTAYASLMKPLSDRGGRWTLRLRHEEAQSEEVRLTLQPSGPLPEGFQIYLLDPEQDRLLPLDARRATVRVAPGEERVLDLLIGTPAYLQSQYPTASDAPAAFALGVNYPDPFQTATTIPYAVSEPRSVRVEVFNVLGQRVATLVDGEHAAGRYEVVWDGQDEDGRAVASGLYVYRLTAGSTITTRTMMRVR